MAGIISYFCVFVVFLHVCFPKTSLHRRFSDFKRCADEECSMLLCRGKAARDFSGPDCRFLSFKKGETIYVYYKLSGQRSDLWAGSVGSSFGYFPKDFLNINHIYTEEEIEIPAEETDFVCFDTGEDEFESYNTDLLLSNSLLNEGDKQNEEPEQKGPSEDTGFAAEDLDESHIEAGDMDVKDSDPLHKESEDEREVYTEEVSDLEPAEPSQLPLGASASDAKDKVSDVVKDNARSQEKSAQDARSDPEEISAVDIPDEQSPKDAGVLQKSDHVTQVKAVPELKTTLGTTFDAVVSNDEHTWKVNPSYDEEESKTLVVQPSEQSGGGPKQPALLSFEGHIADPAESKGEDLSLQPAAELQKEAAKATEDMWSLGDTVYKIVSGGERTDLPGDSMEEEEEEDTDTGETQNDALQVQDSEIAEDADEIQHSKNDFMKEDLITNVTQYIDFSEQDSKELKSENEVEDIESNDESESSENTLDLDQTENKNKKSKLSKKTLILDEKDIEDNDKSEHTNNFDLNERENKDNDKSKHSENKLDLNEREINNNDKSKHSENKLDLNERDSEDNVKSERSKNNFDLTEREIEHNDKSEHSDNLDLDERENKNNYRSEHSGNNLDLNNREIENDVSKHSENKLDLNESEIEDNDKSEHSKNNKDLTEREIDDNDKSEHSKNNLDLIESEIENNAKSELAKKMLDLDETLYDAVAESEPDTPSYNLEDKPAKTATDNIVLETDINTIELHKSEGLAKAQGAQKSPQFDEKRDEQIDRVKNNIINLFEDTLKAESKPEAEDDPEVYEENVDNEELLEDENAVSSSKTDLTDEEGEQPVENGEIENAKLASPKQPTENLPKQTNERTQKQTSEHTKASLDLSVSTHAKETDAQSTEVDGASRIKQDLSPSEEPEYSDSVLRLTLLRDHFKDSEIERLQWYLGLKDLFIIEAMFTELDQKLKTARESDVQAGNDMERKLESIVEVSENSILDEIEKMLDAQEQKAQDLGRQMNPVIDDEAAILDDFQEFIFYLYQKYSAISDSVPLVEENHSHSEIEKLQTSEEEEDSSKHIPVPEVTETPKVHEKSDKISSVNPVQEADSHSQDMSLEEDGGHFNKNKDIQAGFKETEEMQRGPQAILENPVDIAFGFEMEPSSGSLESPRTSDFYDNNANQASASTSDHVWDLLAISFGFLGVYSETLIAALPEEWQPGPTFHGLPWKPVVVTAIVGILTALMLIWRTVLAVKSRTYLLNEKQLEKRIHQLVSEKSDVLLKITELNNMIKQHEEKLNNSEKSQSSMLEKYEDLKVHYQALQGQREEMSASIYHLGQKITETQEKNKALNKKMEVMHQRIEKYQSTLELYDEERSKVQVLMDEAKLREDALKAQVLSFEKDNSALKEQKKSLLRDAKDWQEKHEKLSEEIKVYHKTRKDLEDALVHKENEIDALSSCIAELKSLELCDPEGVQKGDAKLANGEMADKGDHIKLRLKQMMDVSRIKVTLSVIEDERNRYLENFLTEQKTRHELEEQFQKVIHDQTNLKNEKTHLESQYNNLQQRLEITTELYQQKENALQQKLTQEELERREKESKLSEVDGRTLQAEEELSGLKKKVKDMQKEMQQNERSLRAEIAVQEKKAHENWLKARASERALMEERRESANLRQKMVECSDKMADLEHALYKSGPSDRHMNPPLRIGDSYGPSPVSGGAPSPPLMIEGPGRPPSAPVGRRNEPFGPRPIDTGRFSDLGHPVPSRPEMYAPRTSSPCIQDGSLSKSQSQGLFLPSPIRDSPEASSNPPQKVYSSQHMGGPPSNGLLPPMSRPPNDLLPLMSSGPLLGPDPRFRPPHMDSYGPPPLRPYGPMPPPFARGLPRRDLPPLGPPPPPFGMHGFPPDFAGPRDLPFPPLPYASGSVPPPGALVPPLFGSREPRGPVPPMSHPTRDNEDIRQATGHAAEDPGQQRAEQHTTTSAVAEP